MKTTLSKMGFVVLGFFLLTAAGISPALGESNKSFGAEDWVVRPLVTPSFGTEDWVGPMEYSEVAETGALPESAPQELSLDNYYPD